MRIRLVEMRQGEKGKIVQIQGGMNLKMRLENLGLVIDKEIIKVSSQLFRGPVVIEVGNTQVAIGFGMAQKIIVEVER